MSPDSTKVEHTTCDWRLDADKHGWTCRECGRQIVAPDRESMVARGLTKPGRAS